ncbi:hypothetical protein J1N35_002931 [Gossypium stocksii]|uniref:Protein kinase domain-containing protein n=1 Tax=Gossypium stocksii TaxID=47602 RepID=A0A9D4AP74_9ROSI|nr:hypothetical protein J1N35_002931 [Gossypium stocksii]
MYLFSNPTSIAQPKETKSKGKYIVVGGEGFVRKFSWDEIKDVTKDFSLVIGQGRFSIVYLANLFGNSRQGAVKVHSSGDRLIQVFKQELDILLRLQHDNIVKLLGYCNDLGTLQKGALVFEYIHNGNLQEELHERNKEVLPWKTMTGCIAIGSRHQSFCKLHVRWWLSLHPFLSDNSYQQVSAISSVLFCLQFIPKKGVSPTQHEIIFIAPTGEEISNKRQLEKYLNAHPGGPAASEFYWGTGETPRRSARISEKKVNLQKNEAAASKDNKESETASGGIEETKDIHMEEAEKSEKMNVEGENKDETEVANSKTEPTSQEVQHAEDANISTHIKERKENAKKVSEKSQDGVQAGTSGFAPAEEERLESLLIEGKVKQPVAEAEKELQSGEQNKKKKEVGGEEKAKQERSASESEGAIKEKQSSNCNEGQNYSVGNEISKKTEAAIQNGSNAGELFNVAASYVLVRAIVYSDICNIMASNTANGYSQTGLLIKQDPGQLTSMIASQICGAFEIEKSY